MESDFIRWLRSRVPTNRQTIVGIGDDAAILDFVAGKKCVVTSDLLTDEIDFELAKVDPRRVGHKALAVNLSDLAAMAAKPVAAIVSLVLPHDGGSQLAKSLYEGILPLAERFEVSIAGGDTNSWSGKLAISITALGEVSERAAWLRSGARAGDAILVTGQFGGSILGKHLDFEPRVHESLKLQADYEIHAAIDVSDGLSLDLSRVADESDCGAVIELASIPISNESHALARDTPGVSALDHALSDGEDFELIFAVSPSEADRLLCDQPLDVPITKIGWFVAERGLWRTVPGGPNELLKPRGFEHEFQ